VIYRDDFLDVSSWSPGNATLATDGDVATLTGTQNLSNYNASITSTVAAGVSTTTYPLLLARVKNVSAGGTGIQITVFYNDSTSQVSSIYTSSKLGLIKMQLNAGKTISSIVPFANMTALGQQFSIDFVQVYKEDLNLPAIIQPMPVSTGRIVAVLPILQRDGEVLQDLGSKSPELIIQGALVSTTTPTNHTAAEWWDLLEGLVLEAANETWQWVTSDRIHYKYLPIDLSRSEILSRKNYYEFTLRLKRFDVLSQTPDRLGISY